MIERLKEQLTEKGHALNKFREEHNITVRGEKETERKPTNANSNSGVLVPT